MNILIFLIISLQGRVLDAGKINTQALNQHQEILPTKKNLISKDVCSINDNGIRLISSSSSGCVFEVNKISEQTKSASGDASHRDRPEYQGISKSANQHQEMLPTDTQFVLVGVPQMGNITVDGGTLVDTVRIRRHRIAKIMVVPGETQQVRVRWNNAKENPGLSEKNSIEDILKGYVVNYETSKYWLAKPDIKLFSAAKESPGVCKIIVDSEGVYRINYSDIVSVVPEIATMNPQTIKITHNGLELPIFVQGEEDGVFYTDDWIEFYAQPVSGEQSYLNMYTYKNVYWLSIGWQKGARLVKKDGKPGQETVPTNYPFSIHFELDSINEVFKAYPDTIAPWFWAGFDKKHSFNLTIPSPISSGNCNIKVDLRTSGGPGNLKTYLNNNLINTTSFASDMGVPKVIDISVPQSFLKEASILTLEPSGGNISVYLNSIDINYFKSYVSQEGKIKFTAPSTGKYKFQLTGFKNPEIFVWQTGTAFISNGEVDTLDSTYTFNFEDTYSDSTFYLAQDYTMKPSLIKSGTANLRNSSNMADYIIITSSGLYDCAVRYANWQETKGFTCKVVNVQDIYDEFNYGIPYAMAIKEFLKYAYTYWATPPVYVLLLGDASYDHRNIYGFDEDIVPATSIFDDYYVLIPSDNIYACVDGTDPIPDMLIGRLPVKDVNEFEIVFNKIQRQFSFSDWRSNLIFTSMVTSENPIDATNQFIKLVPPEYKVEKLYYPTGGAQTELVDLINKGASFLTYIGHSGPREWSGGLLWNEALPGLMNIERLAFVSVLGCYNAIFDVPGKHFMGENFILSPGGAFAYWGSSGSSFLRDKGLVEGPLLKSFDSPNNTVGELTFDGIIRCFANSQGAKSIEQQTLLGDPGSKFSLPQKLNFSILPTSFTAGETCSVVGNFSSTSGGAINGEAIITLCVNDTTEFKKIRTTVSNGNWNARFYLPDTISLPADKGKLFAYIYNGNTDFVAAANFSINRTNIVISTTPELPTHNDSVYVRAKIFDPSGIRLVKCNWGISPPPWNQINMGLDTSGYFITENSIPYQLPGSIVSLQVYVENNLGEAFTEVDSYKVASLPDIEVIRSDIKLDGTKSVQLNIPIINKGEQNTDSFDVIVYRIDSLNDTSLLWKSFLSLKGKETRNISIPWNIKKGSIFIFTDSANVIEESNETNNFVSNTTIPVTLFNVWPLEGTRGWCTSTDSLLKCLVPLQTVSDSTVLEIRSDTSGGFLALRREGVNILKDILIEMPNNDSLAKPAIHRWCEEYKQWVVVNAGTLAYTRKLGLFKLSERIDTLAPEITLDIPDSSEFKSSGQEISLKINAIIKDKDGVDILDRGIIIEHDTVIGAHDTVSHSLYTYPTEDNSLYAVPLIFKTSIGVGKHTFLFIAYDLQGNKTTKSAVIVVTPPYAPGKNYCWGNYPNPVKGDRTEFKFGFTSAPEMCQVKIYTVSGKLIKTLIPPVLSKDISIVWDLRADNGTLCGNDVYFYKVFSRQGKVQIEKLMKLVILR
ncbi:MAG: C25 family cysteine peptidase [bacterium]|nr:C25 family cysteine peptidase [bacterium]